MPESDFPVRGFCEVRFRGRRHSRVCALSSCHVSRNTNVPVPLAPKVAWMYHAYHAFHDKGKPAARRGRKASGLRKEIAGLPKRRASGIDTTPYRGT